jgi:SAM-dependent methyltransferase
MYRHGPVEREHTFPVLSIEDKQRIEIEYWRDSEHESPESDSILNILNKMSDASVLIECLGRHQRDLARGGRVLELGAGQGWASCVYKRLYPSAQVIATDLSPYAVQSVQKWERLFEVSVDHAYACKSYATQEADASVDRIFCFAAAHHFLEHRKTLVEINRILKPGGAAYYFHEPTTPRFWYRLVFRHVNSNRPEVPEDVLITSRLKELAQKAGLDLTVDYHPSLTKRGPLETVYFYVQARLPFLQRFLPSTANLVFRKASTGHSATARPSL